MKVVLAISLLFATPALSQLSTASGNWDNIPMARQLGKYQASTASMVKLDAALAGSCIKRERRSQRLDLRIPFLIEFGSDRSVKRVVVKKLNCPDAEALLGNVILGLAQNGEYVPTGLNQANWYRGEFLLTSR